MLPVQARRFPRHLRPGTAEVSLRHVSGWVIGGCRSSNLTVSNAALANASIDRHRYPQPTDPSVCRASAGAGSGWLGSPFCTPGFLFLRPLSLASCTDPCLPRLLLERLSGARPARPLDGVIGPQDGNPRSPCRNGGCQTFLPRASPPPSTAPPA